MNLYHIRRDFDKKTLGTNFPNHPFEWFEQWLQEVLQSEEPEPTATILSTVGTDLKPSSRVVLLKYFNDKGFTFFTNYDSKKGIQLDENPYASLVFFWSILQRQVRIEGKVEKTSLQLSDEYFNKRPLESRVNASISPQSMQIPSMDFLYQKREAFINLHTSENTFRPANWGGYLLKPDLFEFWQGGANRLHERIEFVLDNDNWKHYRLAP